MNQISHLQFCACANSPILYCCKNKENQCSNSTECLIVVDNYQHTMHSSLINDANFICFVFSDILILMLTNHGWNLFCYYCKLLLFVTLLLGYQNVIKDEFNWHEDWQYISIVLVHSYMLFKMVILIFKPCLVDHLHFYCPFFENLHCTKFFEPSLLLGANHTVEPCRVF